MCVAWKLRLADMSASGKKILRLCADMGSARFGLADSEVSKGRAEPLVAFLLQLFFGETKKS